MSLHLELDRVSFRYDDFDPSANPVLKQISLNLGHPECLAVLGPSGSGKTTLIQHFTGLLQPSSGQVRADGRSIWDKGYPLVELRRRIGLVFQFPEMQLFEETVYKDVAFGPRNLGYPASEVERRALEAMAAVDLDPELYSSRSPFHLSEGEKRRAAIAGVLAMGPEMVVFDEPTAGLDPKGVQLIQRIVRRLREEPQSVVLVTHHMDFVLELADRAVVLVAGEMVFNGPPAELFRDRELLERADLERPAFTTALDSLDLPFDSPLRKARRLRDFAALLGLPDPGEQA